MTLRLNGTSSGFTEIDAPAAAGSNKITLPTSNGSAEQFLKNSGTAGELEFSNMVETSTGVGIGTSSPDQKLQVEGSGSQYIAVTSTNSDNTGVLFGDSDIDSGYVLYANSDNSLRFGANAGERARLDSSGQLGIATSSPDAELHVGGSAPHIDIGPDDSNRCKIGYSGGDMHFGVSASAGDFHFKRNVTSTGNPADDGTVVAQFLSEGRLKVTNTGGSGSAYHTNTNFSSFHQSNGGNVIAGFENSHASDGYGIVIRFSGGAPDNNSNYYIECNDTSDTRFQVLSDGDVRNHDNSYGSTSDEKLKQDIVDAGSQWDDLKDLRVRKFRFKSDVAAYGDEAKVLIGLVAQEAELVSPGLVTDSPDLDDDGNDLGTVTKSVRYSVLYMKAVKALQEAQTRIETLETQNTAQQTQIDDLLARVTALEAA